MSLKKSTIPSDLRLRRIWSYIKKKLGVHLKIKSFKYFLKSVKMSKGTIVTLIQILPFYGLLVWFLPIRIKRKSLRRHISTSFFASKGRHWYFMENNRLVYEISYDLQVSWPNIQGMFELCCLEHRFFSCFVFDHVDCIITYRKDRNGLPGKMAFSKWTNTNAAGRTWTRWIFR